MNEKAIAWAIDIVISFIVGILFLISARKISRETEAIARIRTGYAIFIIGWAITRIFFILSDYEYNQNGDTSLYALLIKPF